MDSQDISLSKARNWSTEETKRRGLQVFVQAEEGWRDISEPFMGTVEFILSLVNVKEVAWVFIQPVGSQCQGT